MKPEVSSNRSPERRGSRGSIQEQDLLSSQQTNLFKISKGEQERVAIDLDHQSSDLFSGQRQGEGQDREELNLIVFVGFDSSTS
jgi:hypothetical protein